MLPASMAALPELARTDITSSQAAFAPGNTSMAMPMTNGHYSTQFAHVAADAEDETEDEMPPVGNNQDSEEDESEDDDEEEEIVRSGSEFSALSGDEARALAAEDARLEDQADDRSDRMDVDGEQDADDDDDPPTHAETSKAGRSSYQAAERSVLQDAELNPDLYGIRRSVCNPVACPASLLNILEQGRAGVSKPTFVSNYVEDDDDEPVRFPRKRVGKGKARGAQPRPCYSLAHNLFITARNDSEDSDPVTSRQVRRSTGESSADMPANGDLASPSEESEGDDAYGEVRRKRSRQRARPKLQRGKKRRSMDDDDDDLDTYASYGARNAPRKKLGKSVNYDENEAYDSMLSDTISDEEVGNADSGYNGQDEGDAVDGVFDHRRAEGRGMSPVTRGHTSS